MKKKEREKWKKGRKRERVRKRGREKKHWFFLCIFYSYTTWWSYGHDKSLSYCVYLFVCDFCLRQVVRDLPPTVQTQTSHQHETHSLAVSHGHPKTPWGCAWHMPAGWIISHSRYLATSTALHWHNFYLTFIVSSLFCFLFVYISESAKSIEYFSTLGSCVW